MPGSEQVLKKQVSPSLEQIFKPQVLVVFWGCTLSFLSGVWVVTDLALQFLRQTHTLGPFKLLHEASCHLAVRARQQPENPLHVVGHLHRKEEPGVVVGVRGGSSDVSPVHPTHPTPDCMPPHRSHLDVHS